MARAPWADAAADFSFGQDMPGWIFRCLYHHHYTGSELAARILLDFNRALPRFVKVLPTDYKRVLAEEAAKAAEAKKAEMLQKNPLGGQLAMFQMYSGKC